MQDSSDFPLGEPEVVFLRELTRVHSRFMIVGLGAAVLQGADAVTQDLDLWFRSLADPAIALAARTAGGVFVTQSTVPNLPIADFSVKILPLERVMASKRAAGRPKDKAALEALRAAIVARAAMAKKG